MQNPAIHEPELFEPGSYIQTAGPGYFSVLAKPSGRARQESHELRFLPEVIHGLNPRIDTWVTQAVFNCRNRRAVNMQSVGLMFADLDTYHAAGLRDRKPEAQAAMLTLFCREVIYIPIPSIVLFSGRGLQAKWLLDEALLPVELVLWNEVQAALVRALDPFAADVASRDISRVLRVEHTINTKSGEFARVITVTGDPPIRYDFADMQTALEPWATPRSSAADEDLVATKPAKSMVKIIKPASFGVRRLNWTRLSDLRELWKMRGGVPEGCREMTLFWELVFLLGAEPGRTADIWREAEALAAQIDPGVGWWRKSDLSTVYRKARESRNGQMVEFQGREYPSMYWIKNTTLLELFKITPEEERTMRTIISKAEKDRRWKVRETDAARPWVQEGIPRRTWYWRKAKELHTLSCEGDGSSALDPKTARRETTRLDSDIQSAGRGEVGK